MKKYNFQSLSVCNVEETVDIEVGDLQTTDYESDDVDYVPEEKKGKFQFSSTGGKMDDDMPDQYQHVRYGLRSVRTEIYSVMNKLSAEFHMTKSQIEGSIITIANSLFGREWRPYSKNEIPDLNTLPSMRNIIHTEPSFEAMALNAIVEEMMKDECNACITYSNDGSSMNGVGAYVVQSLMIDGAQHALPTLGVFTESRETLKDLEITTLKILSAASGHKYSEQDILRRISFVMTDSTAHNLEVIESVCEELNVDEIPGTLLCNIHPLMMFQGK